MPIYNLKCLLCDTKFEKICNYTDEVKCPNCGSYVTIRTPSVTGFRTDHTVTENSNAKS